MEEREDRDILLLDEELFPVITIEEGEALKKILIDFMEGYTQNADKPVKEWMCRKMQQNFPEKKAEEIQNMMDEILSSLETAQEKKQDLDKAIENGISKESWFASEIKKAVSTMSSQETVKYLSNLDEA